VAPGAKRPPPAARSRVRIIGGVWRSRLLEFPETAGLRPTPDRVRETVFNWLAPHLPGARCLDLFAGSGAFGFEALSRGAARAVLVERDVGVARALRGSRERLGAASAEIVETDALAYLEGEVETFDIVFLDPPYASGLLGVCAPILATRGWLKPGGFVYLETDAGEPPPLPAGWELIRSKTAGQVGYHLARSATRQEGS
jgi:16S rRNA (guanine966-N2)-methyltransferase